MHDADPTAVQRIRHACATIVDAWPYLADATDATLTRRRLRPRQLTAADR